MRSFRKLTTQLSALFLLFFLWNCTTTNSTDADQNSAANGTGSDGSDLSNGALHIEKVLFGFDEQTISPEFYPELEQLADFMKKNPATSLRIAGHCDERGTVEYNLALGQRRADEVKRFLMNHGVDSARLSTHSYGKEMLADTSSTEQGHSLNRRAELVSSNTAQENSSL